MRTRSRKTLLQCLMVQRHLTREQAVEALERRARDMGVRDFALGLRQFDRWLAGDLITLPRPSLCRVLEAEFRHPVQQLLAVSDGPGEKDQRGPLPSSPQGPAAPPELREWAAQTLARPDAIGEGLLEGIWDHTGALAGAFHALPPEALIGAAGEHLELIVRLTRCSMRPAQRRRLLELGADVATLMGWLCLLVDRDAQAHAYLALAAELARESGNPTLEAGVAGSMARASSPSLTWRGGDPTRALELVERADALAPEAEPLMRSWLGERRAIESACAGDPGASDRALDQAREALRGDTGEMCLEGFLGHVLRSQDQWYLTTVEGLCHILLGRGELAEVALTEALDQAGPSRTRLPIMLVADLAAAYVLRDEPEAATRALAECHRRAVNRGFAVGRQRARNVRARFPASWQGLQCVADLDDRMALST